MKSEFFRDASCGWAEFGPRGQIHRFQVDQPFEPRKGGLGEFLGQATAAVFGLDLEIVKDCHRALQFVFDQHGHHGLEFTGEDFALLKGGEVESGGSEEAGVADFNASGNAVLAGLDFPEVDGPLADGGEAFEAGLAGDGREGDEFGYCHQIASPSRSPPHTNKKTAI